MAKYPYRCPDCKTEVILRQRVTQTKRKCSYCGTPITTIEIDRQTQEKAKQQAIIFLIIIGIGFTAVCPPILVLMILISIISLGIKGSRMKNKPEASMPITIADKSDLHPAG